MLTLKKIFKFFNLKNNFILYILFLTLILITSASKVTAQDNLDFSLLRGTWKGTLSSSIPKSSKKTTNTITITFNSYDSGKFKTTQIFTNNEKNINDTSEVSIQGDIKPSFLHLVYQHLGEDKKNYCDVILFLKYSIRYGFQRLDGDKKSGNDNCSNIDLSLVKVSNDFNIVKEKINSSTNSTPNSPTYNNNLNPTAAQLFKTVRLLPENDEVFGKVVQLDISDKEKTEFVKECGLTMVSNDSLFTEKDNDQPFKAGIDVCDYNDDGKYELVLWKRNGLGPAGTSEFDIYYKTPNSTFRNILSEYGGPTKMKSKEFGFYNIAIAGPGFNTPVYIFDGIKYRFSSNKSAEEMKPVDESKLVGGSTPDELGRILLKAIKTNNKQLWINCMVPDNEKYGALCEQEFNRIRDKLEQKGLTDWSLISFSRVTYSKEYMSSNDNGVVDGEQVRRNFVIEFFYKNKEFIGGIGSMTIQTFKNGKYLVYFPGYDAGLVRYRKK